MLLTLPSPRRETTSDSVSATLDQLVSREIYPELDGPTCETVPPEESTCYTVTSPILSDTSSTTCFTTFESPTV
ncbi:hypothetical protein M0802_003030 [Mischocyttarus mexicanus]|nr:hypothetical protein M0802_003030 [Mischocyttarus mexicanus]